MLKRFLEVGQIVGTHGVRGELRVQPWCDSPEFIKQFKKLYFSDKGENTLRVVTCRPHGNIVILKLEGVDTVDRAQALRNRVLFMDRNDAALEDGAYFIQDLIGCDVTDADSGMRYGVLSNVSETGANDVWHIKADNGREYLLPAIPDVVVRADVEERFVLIRPLEGIFDDED